MANESSGEDPFRCIREMRSPPRDALDGCRVFAREIAGVDVCFLVPPKASAASQILYLHGGAFTSGPVVCHWGMLARVCKRAGLCAVMVDYGLAPRRPYPAGLTDVLAVYGHLRAKPGVDAICFMGDSAGGGLALASVLALKDEQKRLPEKLVLLSPWLDLTLSNPEIESIRAYDELLGKEALVEAGRQYAAGHDPAHYRLSPVNGDVGGLPPILLEIGTHDILVCDCRRFRDKVRDAGGFLVYREWDAMFHDWMTQAPQMPAANQAIDEIVDFLAAPLAAT